jgi:hypothetical protein
MNSSYRPLLECQISIWMSTLRLASSQDLSHLLYGVYCFRYKHLGQFAPLGGEQTAAQLPGDWVSIGHSSQWLWYSVYARYRLSPWLHNHIEISNWVDARVYLYGFGLCLDQQASQLAHQGVGDNRLDKAFRLWKRFQSHLSSYQQVARFPIWQNYIAYFVSTTLAVINFFAFRSSFINQTVE